MAWNELITQVMKNWKTRTGGGEVTQGSATAGSHGRTNGGRSAMKPGARSLVEDGPMVGQAPGRWIHERDVVFAYPYPFSPLPAQSQILSSSHPAIFLPESPTG